MKLGGCEKILEWLIDGKGLLNWPAVAASSQLRGMKEREEIYHYRLVTLELLTMCLLSNDDRNRLLFGK